MGRRLLWVFLFAFFLFSGYASASPFWFKPGSEVQYYANAATSRAINAWGFVYYHWSNCTANVGFQRIKLSFDVINVSGEWALVRIRVDLYGGTSLRWPYSDVYAYYPSFCVPPFPNPLNVTPYPAGDVPLKWADYGTEVNLTGYYRINLPSGWFTLRLGSPSVTQPSMVFIQ